VAVFVIGNGDNYMSPCFDPLGIQMMCDAAPVCDIPNGVTDFRPFIEDEPELGNMPEPAP
jgi:hypothetical protein